MIAKADFGFSLTAVLIAAFVGVPFLHSQGQNITVVADAKNSPRPLVEASRYFELPPQRLKEAVPGLRGLKYDADQRQLPSILAGVAKAIGDLMPRLPNLVSKEVVEHYQAGQDSVAWTSISGGQPWNDEFRYLILVHHQSDGTAKIEELRTDSKGRPADAKGQVTGPRGNGFAYQWLLFSAANQPEFQFRYLGQQDLEGRKTFVVAFAQDPAKVADPAYFQSQGKTAPFYYQGVLWVDQTSFNIVKLRTDLLAPVPIVKLNQLTTEVSFRSVPIHGYDAVFWLPFEVYLSSDEGGGPVEETHLYSDYHLFHSESRIVPVQ